MWCNCTSQAKQSQFQPSDLEQPARVLINHIKVEYLVLSRPELFQYSDILNQSPDGKDGYWEGDSSGEEVGELRERKVDERVVELIDESLSSSAGGDVEELLTRSFGDQWRILEEVSQNSTCQYSVRVLEKERMLIQLTCLPFDPDSLPRGTRSHQCG